MSLMYLDVTNPMLGTWATEYVMKSQTNRALGYSAPYSPYPYDVTLFGFYVIRKMMQQGIPMTPANVLSMIRNTTMLGAVCVPVMSLAPVLISSVSDGSH